MHTAVTYGYRSDRAGYKAMIGSLRRQKEQFCLAGNELCTAGSMSLKDRQLSAGTSVASSCGPRQWDRATHMNRLRT